MKTLRLAAAGGALTLALLGLSTATAQADTPGTCTAHKANTATWAKCRSNDGAAHWARLKSTCDLPALSKNKTNVTKWELVPAGGELTISDECKFKAVDAVAEWRPY
jgi:hypothetical protein